MNAIASFFTANGFFSVVLTVGVYCFTVWLQRKTKLPFLSPILVSGLLLIPTLLLLRIPIESYQTGTQVLSFFLTPATICLGLSLYTQLQRLKNDLLAITVGVVAGTAVSLLSVWGLCFLFGLDRLLTISLLPKSVTTAIGMVLSEEADGVAALSTAAIILTGNLGNLAGTWFCKLFHITDPIARGVAYGTAAHVIGTSKAMEESPLSGAVGSLSLSVAGLMTALVFPLLSKLI